MTKPYRLTQSLGTALLLNILVSYPAGAEVKIMESWQERKKEWQERGFVLDAVYTGEYWANTRGGIARDDTYLGQLNTTLALDTAQLGLWPGGTFTVDFLDNHGDNKLSGEIVGDLQTISNIEAPRTSRIYQLWYEHHFADADLSALIGIHDYNADFNATEYGGVFINSSFGIGPEMATGARPSIFPLAAFGMRIKKQSQGNWEWMVGVYDGDPGDPEVDEHFSQTDFSSEQGALIAAEVIHHHAFNNRQDYPGTFKIGLWHNTGEFADLIDTGPDGQALIRDGNTGGYLILDQSLCARDSICDIGMFIQTGAAPDHLNEINFYAGAGVVVGGLIPARAMDQFGIALAYASISNDLTGQTARNSSETTIEVTYRAQITDTISIQPDVQFVLNPGANPELENAVITGLRMEITL